MTDLKIAMGLVATAASAGVGWLDYVSDVVTIVVTIVVGGLTAWYTWERASKLKRERGKKVEQPQDTPDKDYVRNSSDGKPK